MGDRISSDNDPDEMELDFEALPEQEEASPEAFYQALKNGLAQLERSADAAWG